MKIITGGIRVSSDEQKKKGQMVNYYKQDLLRNNVKENNILIELGVSGSIDDNDIKFKFNKHDGYFYVGYPLKRKRPLLWDWLNKKVSKKLVKEHKVTKWDRWSRDIILGLLLKKYCESMDCEVIATQDTNDDRVIPILIILAEDEAKQTKKRVSTGKKFKFEHGLYLGTERLYGYKKTKIEIDNRKYLHLKPKLDEKRMILEIFSKKDYKQVCEKYDISSTTYYNIKRNKFYAGYIQYMGKEKKGIHKPLISLERFMQNQ